MKKYKKAYIEITNICNLKCNFCPKTKRIPKSMSDEEFRHVINEVKKFTRFVYLHLMGEPLLNPKFKEIIQISDEEDVNINITSNGFLISNQVDTILQSKSVRKISFSLHSYEANDVSISLESYLKGIYDFAQKAILKDKIVVLKLWNLDSKDLKADNELNEKIVDFTKRYFNYPGNLYDELLKKANVKLLNHLFIQVAEKFEWPDIFKDLNNEKIFCYGLRDQFGILSNGDVVPCCLDNDGNIKLGNVFEEHLDIILSNEKANSFFNLITNGKPPHELCKKCMYAYRKVDN